MRTLTEAERLAHWQRMESTDWSINKSEFITAIDDGFICTLCGEKTVFSGKGWNNSPPGHNMVYGVFSCSGCGGRSGYPSGFLHRPCDGRCNLVWNGKEFVHENAD